MVGTSEKLETHVTDLEELFRTIGKHWRKLNPEKCVFDVQAGKFLEFLLTERVIEANLNKCTMIVGIKSPSNIKEV